MRKIAYSTIITESLSELQSKLKSATHPKIVERLEVLCWLKSGEVTSMKAATKLKNKTTTWGQDLWNNYKSGGLTSCMTLHYKGQPSPLKGKKTLTQHLETTGFNTINEARVWILETYGISYTENSLGNYFRHNKIKLKTARPHHPQIDEEERAAYKKKFESELKPQNPWFQDEMRFGTRTIAARKWTAQGHRPNGVMKQGYSYRYLFQAIQPTTGKTFELYLPNMSGLCFKIFMREFAKAHPNQLMIMDNAGCHHVKWEEGEVYPDVKIAYLSAYSPDYNPQERVFQEIKKKIKGKVYKDTASIEVDIDCKLKEFWDDPQKIKDLTAWDWIT